LRFRDSGSHRGLFQLESSRLGPQGAKVGRVTLPRLRDQAPGSNAMSLKAFLLEQALSPNLC
jgi:hypothetical protein